jgi:hypothetical protein
VLSCGEPRLEDAEEWILKIKIELLRRRSRIAFLPPTGPGFYFRPGNVGFMVDKVALR